jgi:hypothetical protein
MLYNGKGKGLACVTRIVLVNTMIYLHFSLCNSFVILVKMTIDSTTLMTIDFNHPSHIYTRKGLCTSRALRVALDRSFSTHFIASSPIRYDNA